MTVTFDNDVTLAVEIGFASDALTSSPTWTDVSDYVRGFNIRRGRNHQLDRIAPGALTLTLANSDGRFDPSYTTGAYYPNVKPMKQIRVRATYSAVTYDLFRGFVTHWPQTWPGKVDAVTVISAMDGFKILKSRYTTTLESQEKSGTRIGNLLDDAGWPAAWRSLAAGKVDMVAHQPTGATILDLIQQVVDTEPGLFFIDGAGVAVFQARDFRSGLSSAATFGDDGAELRYVDLVLGYDDTQIWNNAEVTIVDGTGVSATDTASVTTYAQRTLRISDTLHLTGTEATGLAYSILNRYADPYVRVESMTVLPRSNPSGLWPQVLGLDVSDKITVKRRPPAGNTITAVSYVEGMSHTVTPLSWVTTFNLSQDVETFWILEDATYGVLDSTTILAY